MRPYHRKSPLGRRPSIRSGTCAFLRAVAGVVSNLWHPTSGFACINPQPERMHHAAAPHFPLRFSEPAKGYDLNGAVLPR